MLRVHFCVDVFAPFCLAVIISEVHGAAMKFSEFSSHSFVLVGSQSGAHGDDLSDDSAASLPVRSSRYPGGMLPIASFETTVLCSQPTLPADTHASSSVDLFLLTSAFFDIGN